MATPDDTVPQLARDARRAAAVVREIIARAEALDLNPEATPVGEAPPHAPDWDLVRDAAGYLEGFAWGYTLRTQDNELLGELTDGRRQFGEHPGRRTP
jgi:hypothetical protein